MGQVQTQYKDAEANYGTDLLNLIVAKGYLNAVKSYITRHEPEILEHFELVVNIVGMEGAVQQQLEADGEIEEALEEDATGQKGGQITMAQYDGFITTLHCRIAMPKGKMVIIK